MKPRLAQTLALLGVTLAVASTRWAWVLASHRPHPRNTLTWTAPVLAGLVALVALVWSVWIFHAHPRADGTVDDSSPARWPLHKLDRAYSVLCCTVGGISALLFLAEVNEPASWFLTGPPLLFAHYTAGMAGWRPTNGPPIWTPFISSAFVLYYHFVAAPGYTLLSRSDNERDETRTLLLIAQWIFAGAHIMLVALVAWLMQA